MVAVLLSVIALSSGSAVGHQDRRLSTTPPAADLSFLHGVWEGKLHYLDVRDNKSKRSLRVSLFCSQRSEGGVECRFVYWTKKDKGDVGAPTSLAVQGATVRWGEEDWQVASQLHPVGGRHEIRLEKRGLDNGVPAKLTRLLLRDGNQLRIRNEAMRDGSTQVMIRTEFRLHRVVAR